MSPLWKRRAPRSSSSGEETLHRFMRMVWLDVIERWRHRSTIEVYPAARRLVEAGADPDVVTQLCGSVALDTLAVIQHSLDYGFDPESGPDELPGWALVETQPPDHEPTHVRLNWLHESGLLADPRGDEGADLWKAPGEAPGIDFGTEVWRRQAATD